LRHEPCRYHIPLLSRSQQLISANLGTPLIQCTFWISGSATLRAPRCTPSQKNKSGAPSSTCAQNNQQPVTLCHSLLTDGHTCLSQSMSPACCAYGFLFVMMMTREAPARAIKPAHVLKHETMEMSLKSKPTTIALSGTR